MALSATMMTAVKERYLPEDPTVDAKALGLDNLFMSATNADASRIAAYCEITAKIPVAAATAIAKYLTASVAPAKLPNPAIIKIPISTSAGATCAEIICDLFSFHRRNSSFSFIFKPHFRCLIRPQWPVPILEALEKFSPQPTCPQELSATLN